MPSILDLPKEQRDARLAQLGMTVEEFKAETKEQDEIGREPGGWSAKEVGPGWSDEDASLIGNGEKPKES